MAQEKDNDPFHDSDLDIFDLYNILDGMTREDGLLDIRVLDQFSQEDAAALNVVRLKEIWTHTATGCPKCADIIRSLNIIRGTLKEDAEEILQGQQAIELKRKVNDSIS